MIVRQPKIQYYVGDKLDLSGMDVGIKFNDNSIKTIDEYSCSISSDTVLEISHNKAVITINYKEQQYTAELHFSVREKPFINTLKNSTPDEIKKMIDAANNNQINLKDYWKVGDRFTIRIDDKSKVPYGWYQEINFQIEDMDGELFGVKYHAAIGMRNVVNIREIKKKYDTIYNTATTEGVYEFIKLLPESLKSIMKNIKVYYEYKKYYRWGEYSMHVSYVHNKMISYSKIQLTGSFPSKNTISEYGTIDEIFGPENARKARQFEYFKNSSNRIKYYVNNSAIKYSLLNYEVYGTTSNGIPNQHLHDMEGHTAIYHSSIENSSDVYGDSYFFVI